MMRPGEFRFIVQRYEQGVLVRFYTDFQGRLWRCYEHDAREVLEDKKRLHEARNQIKLLRW